MDSAGSRLDSTGTAALLRGLRGGRNGRWGPVADAIDRFIARRPGDSFTARHLVPLSEGITLGRGGADEPARPVRSLPVEEASRS